MLHRELIAVCSKIRNKQESQKTNKHIVCGQNVEICMLNRLLYKKTNGNKKLLVFFFRSAWKASSEKEGKGVELRRWKQENSKQFYEITMKFFL
jgi:hypothetical protein